MPFVVATCEHHNGSGLLYSIAVLLYFVFFVIFSFLLSFLKKKIKIFKRRHIIVITRVVSGSCYQCTTCVKFLIDQRCERTKINTIKPTYTYVWVKHIRDYLQYNINTRLP